MGDLGEDSRMGDGEGRGDGTVESCGLVANVVAFHKKLEEEKNKNEHVLAEEEPLQYSG